MNSIPGINKVGTPVGLRLPAEDQVLGRELAVHAQFAELSRSIDFLQEEVEALTSHLLAAGVVEASDPPGVGPEAAYRAMAPFATEVMYRRERLDAIRFQLRELRDRLAI